MRNHLFVSACLCGMLLLIPAFTYSEPFDYKKEQMMRLCPEIDTTTTRLLASYLASTITEPEHSIRIMEIDGQSYLEVRIVENNLLNELCSYWSAFMKMQEKGPFSIKTYDFKVKISNSFRDNALKVFAKIIAMTKIARDPTDVLNVSGTRTIMLYDGPTYEFKVNINGRMSGVEIIYPLEPSDFRDWVAKTNQQLVSDMLNGSFDELKYDVYK